MALGLVAIVAALYLFVFPGELRPRRRRTRRVVARRGPRIVPATTIWPVYPPRPPATTPPPPPRIHRDVLSPDPVEQELLADLRRDPASQDTRMVLADLLEQRGLAASASFVRGTDQDDDPLDVLEQSDFAWRAITSRDRTDCGRTTCPRTWEQFVPTDDERCRRCFLCGKTVRYCATIAEERACLERGERAVIDLGGATRPR